MTAEEASEALRVATITAIARYARANRLPVDHAARVLLSAPVDNGDKPAFSSVNQQSAGA